MNRFQWLVCMTILGVWTLASVVHAVTLEVTHTPGGGQYGTIAAALAVAGDNDVIRIVDNSAPFNEAVATSLNNLTIEGLSSLDPRPTIIGPDTDSPYDPGFHTGFTYNGTGFVCRDLILQTHADNHAVVDGRFGAGAQFDNVRMEAPAATYNAFRCQTAATLTDCELQGGLYTLSMWLGGTLTLNNCLVGTVSQTVSAYLHGGTTVFNNCTLTAGDGAMATVRVRSQIEGVATAATFNACVVTLDQEGSYATPILVEIEPGAASVQDNTVVIDNCDLVGRGDAGSGIVYDAVADVTITDTIFSNIPGAVYEGITADNNPTGYRLSENYCAYKNCPGLTQGLLGAASRVLTLSDVLYLNVFQRDLQLFVNSPAAALNSTGTPPYAGSKGVYSGAYSQAAEGWRRTEVDLLNGFQNMYNPHVIEDDTDPAYPYRMYFFGWAVTDCNNPGYPGCDAIFVARGSDLETWEVYAGSGTWDTTGTPSLWEPVIVAQTVFYNEDHNGDPSVVKRDGTYYMVYSTTGFDVDGLPPWDPSDTDDDISVIMGATSSDGLNWTLGTTPTLMCHAEVGQPNDATVMVTPGYTGAFHRPSLMWDGDHWRMWFDFWQSGSHHGTGMGHAECAVGGDFMNPNDWTITHPLSQGVLEAWPNPDVVKYNGTYYSFGDPNLYPATEWIDWDARQMLEATSPDGIDWTIQRYVFPDSDTPAMQVPEAFMYTDESGNDWMVLFYGAQRGGDPYDFRFKHIRSMRRLMSPLSSIRHDWVAAWTMDE